MPGHHASDSYNDLGYLKLRRAIVEWVCPHRREGGTAKPSVPILCQFSSIGSLNKVWLDKFLSAIDSSSTRDTDPIRHAAVVGSKGEDARSQFTSRAKIIWPTVEEIRTSVEGYCGGGSVPGKVQNLSKDFLQPLFHRWSSGRSGGKSDDPLKTARHIPHMKSYIQPSSSDTNEIEWLVLTSHNLSIAAWGQIQNRSAQSRKDDKVLFMCNWELGVFMSSATLAKANTAGKKVRMKAYPGLSSVINVDSDDENENNSTNVILPIPFNMNPTPYNTSDVPWAVDRDYAV